MLKRNKLLNGLSHVENNLPHHDLIVLDNPLVEKDDRYQSLMSSKQHKTERMPELLLWFLAASLY
jgi:hypothetical protein